jgi:hypothetical protein
MAEQGRGTKSMKPAVYVSAVRSQRTPPGTLKVEGKYCSLHHGNARSFGDSKPASEATQKTLGAVFPELRVDDPVCDLCFQMGRNHARALSEESVPGQGSGAQAEEPPRRVSTGGVMDMDLDAMVPDAARSLSRKRPTFNPDLFDEFDEDHPWQGKRVADVFVDDGLVAALSNLSPGLKREALHGVGAMIQAELNAWVDRSVKNRRLETEAAREEAYRVAVGEFVELVKTIPKGVEALTAAPWAALRAKFDSDRCVNLRALVEHLIAGDKRAHVRQSRENKLFKALEPLLQLAKIRSEQCSGIALLWSVYLFPLGVTETPMSAFQKIGLTVDPDTRRKAETEWVARYHGEAMAQVLSGDFQLVVDNFQMFFGVRDVRADAQSNTFIGTGGYVMLRPVAPEMLSHLAPQAPVDLVLDEDGMEEVVGLLARVAGGILKACGVKLGPSSMAECGVERIVEAKVTKRVSLPIVDCNIGTHPGTLAALYRYTELCKMDDRRVWPVLGDAATVRNIHRVSAVFEADRNKGVRLETLPGLFHMQMCGPMALLWKLHLDEIKAAASVLNAAARIKPKVHANFSTHNRVCLFAAQAHTMAAWEAFCGTVDAAGQTTKAFLRWIVQGGTEVSTTKSRKWRRFLLFLLVNAAWDEAIEVENGEAILLFMRFLVPYLAAISSSFYFDIVVHFASRVLALSPRDRFVSLQSLFVNPTGKDDGGVAADMALERDFGDMKHLVRAPRPDADFLAKVSERRPLYQQVREIVEEGIAPAKVSVSRTTADLTSSISQLAKRHVTDYASSEALAPPRIKGKRGAEVPPVERQHAKLDRAFTKCRKKLNVRMGAVAEDDLELGEEFFIRGVDRVDEEEGAGERV